MPYSRLNDRRLGLALVVQRSVKVRSSAVRDNRLLGYLLPERKEGKGKEPRDLEQRHGAGGGVGRTIVLRLRRLFTGVSVLGGCVAHGAASIRAERRAHKNTATSNIALVLLGRRGRRETDGGGVRVTAAVSGGDGMSTAWVVGRCRRPRCL